MFSFSIVETDKDNLQPSIEKYLKLLNNKFVMTTRQKEYGVPFIDSEYAFLKIQEGIIPLMKEMEWQKKHRGSEHAGKVATYLINKLDELECKIFENKDMHIKNKDMRIILVNYMLGRRGIPANELLLKLHPTNYACCD